MAGAPALPGDPFDDLLRIREILGFETDRSALIRRLSRPYSASRTLRIEILPAQTRVVWNSAYPRSANDGLLWAGRGTGILMSAGAQFQWGPLSAALAPEWAWQENAAFGHRLTDRPGFSAFAYPYFTGIDLPQRFGEESYTTAGFGQSYIRLDAPWASLGFSSESLWWGPAVRYPILMSSTAPGFPHAFLRTPGSRSIGIGTVQGEIVWGRVGESPYFDSIPGNDHSMFLGVIAIFSPRWLHGLTLGAARVYQYRPQGEGWAFELDPLLKMFLGSETNLPGNELVSLFARWVFVEAGAEVYGEWARDDRYNDLIEVIQEPDYSQAYVLGMQKIAPVSEALSFRVSLELTALQEKVELRDGSRFNAVYYTNTQVTQGYTNRGQLIGSWIGPGGDAQFVALDAILPWGTAGLFVERVRRHDASKEALAARRWSPYEHDTALTGGIRSVMASRGPFNLAGTLTFGHRIDRDFLYYDRNWGLELHASWAPEIGGWR